MIAFSIAIRSELAWERRYASACSQACSSISLRYGSALTRGSCFALLSKMTVSVSAFKLYPASKVFFELGRFARAAMNEMDADRVQTAVR